MTIQADLHKRKNLCVKRFAGRIELCICVIIIIILTLLIYTMYLKSVPTIQMQSSSVSFRRFLNSSNGTKEVWNTGKHKNDAGVKYSDFVFKDLCNTTGDEALGYRSEQMACQCPPVIPRLSETPLPVTGLFSFPGAGNTWTRHLLQQVSGIYGSLYVTLRFV